MPYKRQFSPLEMSLNHLLVQCSLFKIGRKMSVVITVSVKQNKAFPLGIRTSGKVLDPDFDRKNTFYNVVEDL